MPDTLQNIQYPLGYWTLQQPGTREVLAGSLLACLRQWGSQGRAYEPRNAAAPYSQPALGAPQVPVVQRCHPCQESRSNPGREKAGNAQGYVWEAMGLARTSLTLHKGPRLSGPVMPCSGWTLYPLSWGTWRARLSIFPSQPWLSWHPSNAC